MTRRPRDLTGAILEWRRTSGLGVACPDAQADGVPCPEAAGDCATCDRAELAGLAAAMESPTRQPTSRRRIRRS